jgi:adenylate kinase
MNDKVQDRSAWLKGGEVLVQREDDRPEAIRVRMKAHEDSMRPLIKFYEERGLLVTVSADGRPEEICELAVMALEEM